MGPVGVSLGALAVASTACVCHSAWLVHCAIQHHHAEAARNAADEDRALASTVTEDHSRGDLPTEAAAQSCPYSGGATVATNTGKGGDDALTSQVEEAHTGRMDVSQEEFQEALDKTIAAVKDPEVNCIQDLDS